MFLLSWKSFPFPLFFAWDRESCRIKGARQTKVLLYVDKMDNKLEVLKKIIKSFLFEKNNSHNEF